MRNRFDQESVGIDRDEAERKLWKAQAQHLCDQAKRQAEIDMAPVRIAAALERIAAALEKTMEAKA